MKYNIHSIRHVRKNNGLTLIELVIVTGIIAILFLISFKGLYDVKESLNLNRAAHQLEGYLKDCQCQAMYTGNYFKMDFYPSLNRYRVYRESDLIQDIILENINLHYTNFTGHRVYFNKKGTPSMGGTVTLKTKSNKTLYVIMTPVTARVRISKRPPANW